MLEAYKMRPAPYPDGGRARKIVRGSAEGNMKILIVDDSRDATALISSLLRAAGYYDLETADSGEQALAILEGQNAQLGEPMIDLILMDILMPGMDGIEAVARIKDASAFCDIPIIMISAMADLNSLESAFEAGAMDFIHKPVNRVELRARVRSALRLKEEMDLRKARERELAELNARLEELLGV